MHFKKFLLCAAIIPAIVSCGEKPRIFADGEVLQLKCAGENIQEDPVKSVLSYLQDLGYTGGTDGFLTVRSKTDFFQILNIQIQSFTIMQYHKGEDEYSFKIGTNKTDIANGYIKGNYTFKTSENENCYKYMIANIVKTEQEKTVDYTGYAIFKSIDATNKKIYVDFSVVTVKEGATTTNTDQMTINYGGADD